MLNIKKIGQSPHFISYQILALAAIHIIWGSLCRDSVLRLEGVVGVVASKGEWKRHVVASPLRISFICFLVFLITTPEEDRFPTCQNFKYPGSMGLTDLLKLQFVFDTSGAMDLLPIGQGRKNSHHFIG